MKIKFYEKKKFLIFQNKKINIFEKLMAFKNVKYLYLDIETIGLENKPAPVLEDILVFDCRHLPEPLVEYDFRGKNEEEYYSRKKMFEHEEYKNYFALVVETLQIKVNIRCKSKEARCKVLFICCEGQHRSIAFAEHLKEYVLKNTNHLIWSITHASLKN